MPASSSIAGCDNTQRRNLLTMERSGARLLPQCVLRMRRHQEPVNTTVSIRSTIAGVMPVTFFTASGRCVAHLIGYESDGERLFGPKGKERTHASLVSRAPLAPFSACLQIAPVAWQISSTCPSGFFSFSFGACSNPVLLDSTQ